MSTIVAARAGFVALLPTRVCAPEHEAPLREVIDFWWEVALSC